MEKNNNAGGEVGDEGQPLVKNDFQNVKPLWREGEIQNPPFAPQPMANEIPKNSNYHYQADYEARKDEGEDGEKKTGVRNLVS